MSRDLRLHRLRPCGPSRDGRRPPRRPLVQLLTRAIRVLEGARSAAERTHRRSYESEVAARLRHEIGELRMTRLVEVSAALSRSATQAEIAAVVLTQGVGALYADTGYVALRHGDMLDVVVLPGLPDELAQQGRRIPMTDRRPAVDCILERRSRIYASREEIRARYPNLSLAARFATWVYLPLMVDDQATGAIGMFYAEPTSFGADDRRYMDLLARQCALALDRARLFELEREARRAREEALAIAAHDLRTPLSSISLSAALLEQSADEKSKHRGRVIRTAAERAGELLRDLLDAAVIEQGRLRVQVAPCDGAALLADLRELFAPLAEAKRIDAPGGAARATSAPSPSIARACTRRCRISSGTRSSSRPEGGTIEARLAASGRAAPLHRARLRTRHRSRGRPAALRPLLAGARHEPCGRGPRPLHREGHRGGPRRQRPRGHHARSRHDLHPLDRRRRAMITPRVSRIVARPRDEVQSPNRGAFSRRKAMYASAG